MHSISILIHSISIVYPYSYFFWIRRLVQQVWCWACCSRTAHHGVCLSCLAEFANGRIKGRVKFLCNTAKNMLQCSQQTKTLDVSDVSESSLFDKQVKIKEIYTNNICWQECITLCTIQFDLGGPDHCFQQNSSL